MKKAIAITLAFSLFFGPAVPLSFAGQTEPIPASLNAPNPLGRIEIVTPDFGSKTAKPLVVYIQDAHGNIEGQKNIVQLALEIKKELGLKEQKIPFFLEGLMGRLDPEKLRASLDPDTNRKALWLRLEKGEISAPVYLSTAEADQFDFLPLEDPSLYKADLLAFQEGLEKNSYAIEWVQKDLSETERAAKKAFSKEASTIYRGREHRGSRSDQLLPQVKNLKKIFTGFFKQEADWSASEAETQFKNRFSELSRILELESQGSGEKAEKLKKEIDSPQFFKQLKGLELFLIRVLARSEVEIQYADLLERFTILKDFLSLELSSDQWNSLREKPLLFDPMRLHLEAEALRSSLSEKERRSVGLVKSGELQAAFDRSLRFYEGAGKRDRIFQDRMENYLRTSAPSVFFVLTGGFHGEALKRYFSAKAFPFLLVLPKLEELEKGERLYHGTIRSLELSSITAPYPNDTVSLKTTKAASLGGTLKETALVDIKKYADEIQRLYQMLSEDKVGPVRSHLKEAEEECRIAIEKLAKDEEGSGLFYWGNALHKTEPFWNSGAVNDFLENRAVPQEKWEAARIQAMAADINKRIAQFCRAKNRIPISLAVNESVSLDGLQGEDGRTFAFGRLVYLVDPNTPESEKILREMSPDSILALGKEFSAAGKIVAAGGLLYGPGVPAGNSHAMLMSSTYGTPLIALPALKEIFEAFNGERFKIEIDRKKGIAILEIPSPSEYERASELITRPRQLLARAGGYAVDTKGNLYLTAQGQLSSDISADPKYFEFYSRYSDFYKDAHDNLWRLKDWQVFQAITDPTSSTAVHFLSKLPPAERESLAAEARKIEAMPLEGRKQEIVRLVSKACFLKAGEWHEPLYSEREKYQVSSRGEIYEGCEPLLIWNDDGTTQDRKVLSGDWYVDDFRGDAVLNAQGMKPTLVYTPALIQGVPMTCRLSEMNELFRFIAGNKAAVLAELRAHGFPVPEGSTINFSAYEHFQNYAKDPKGKTLKTRIADLQSRTDLSLDEKYDQIAKWIDEAEVPEDLVKTIDETAQAYAPEGGGPVIFRSTVWPLEDHWQHSTPGVYFSGSIAMPAEPRKTVELWKTVVKSAFAPEALKLYRQYKVPLSDVYPAVLVMQGIKPKRGFVIATGNINPDPVALTHYNVITSAAYGGSADVVGDDAEDNPRAEIESSLPSGELISRRQYSEQLLKTVWTPRGYTHVPLTEAEQKTPVCENQRFLRRAIKYAVDARAYMGRHSDDLEMIEGEDGNLSIVQCRFIASPHFPVRAWYNMTQRGAMGLDVGVLEDYLKPLMEMNRLRNEGDIKGILGFLDKKTQAGLVAAELLQVFESYNNQIRHLESQTLDLKYRLETARLAKQDSGLLEKELRTKTDAIEQIRAKRDEAIQYIIPYFEKGGALYDNLDLAKHRPNKKPFVFKLANRLRKVDKLPDAAQEKIYEILGNTPVDSGIAHLLVLETQNSFIEAMERLNHPENDKFLAGVEPAKLERWRQEFSSRFMQYKRRLAPTSASFMQQHDRMTPNYSDPELDLLKLDFIRSLDVPNLNDYLVPFLAHPTPHVRRRALRDFKGDEHLEQVVRGFQVRREKAKAQLPKIEKRLLEMLNAMIDKILEAHKGDISREELYAAFYGWLQTYPKGLQDLPQSDQQAIERTQDKRMFYSIPEAMHRCFAEKIVTPELMEEIKKDHPNDAKVRRFYKWFNVSDGKKLYWDRVMSYWSFYEQNRRDASRYGEALKEIKNFQMQKVRLLSRVINLWNLKRIVKEDLIQMDLGPSAEALAKSYAIDDQPEFKEVLENYRSELRSVRSMQERFFEFEDREYFHILDAKTLDSAQDIERLFSQMNFSELSYSLLYAQAESPHMVRLMKAVQELDDALIRAAGQDPSQLINVTDEPSQKLLELKEQTEEMLVYLKHLWKRSAFSPFKRQLIYELPVSIEKKGEEKACNVSEVLDDTIRFHKKLKGIKERRIQFEKEAVPEGLPLPAGFQGVELELLLSKIVHSAVLHLYPKDKITPDRKITFKVSASKDAIGNPGSIFEVICRGQEPLNEALQSDGELKVVRRILTEFLNGRLAPMVQDPTTGELKIEIFIPQASGRSLGESREEEISQFLGDQFRALSPSEREAVWAEAQLRAEAVKQLVFSTPLKKTELTIVFGTEALPANLKELERLLTDKRFLVVADPERKLDKLEREIRSFYGIEKLPDNLRLVSLKDEKITSKALSDLKNSFEIEFDDRVALVASEKYKTYLSQAGKVFYPYHLVYSDRSPQDLVLVLAYRLIANAGSIAPEDQGFLRYENGIFVVSTLEELVRRIMLESYSEQVISQAA